MTFAPSLRWIGLFYFVSEVGLSIFKRARSTTTVNADAGSIRLLWIVIIASINASVLGTWLVPSAASVWLMSLRLWWGVTCLAGIAIRWWSILYLGRFFTVNVAIAADHRVIDSGPYRLVRHPSYTGALMGFLGMGLSLGNWLGALVMVAPVTIAFLRRIQIEEDALGAALGAPYRDYMRRTRRLIPFVY